MHIVENLSCFLSLNSARARGREWSLLSFVLFVLPVFGEGSAGQILCRDYYIAFRGSTVSCSLACTATPPLENDYLPLGHAGGKNMDGAKSVVSLLT